ncbi:MAG: SMC-Scp complex subunit ScpB [Euryarchaeota archaeon RBG_13_61_15]|nr:MAG: SMC-Scp complex subunit ScpB [Euryarchaeota archaeon RBG_13_61_15]
MKSERIVEAELFSANKPITVTELQQISGLDARTIRAAIEKLTDEYNGSERAIEISKMGPRYAMQVKKDYDNYASMLADLKIPKEVLKTASLIAYYQPVLQSKLFDLIGNKVYAHVKTLEDLGLVKTKPKKNSVQVTTTKRFIETFGIDARSRGEVKAWFEAELTKKGGRTTR